ncbi:replication-relaxation family protein [Microbacterium sp. cx-55]|uniref:replication-relaxation family protein n=1 Tax=Microbacterium sp. cx-55 TaxID=2875948 RepID=UPI001CC17EB4|nr:replication-relaxation family protein [Microbacterium sp. cx-55]MBZ4488113.1 replication-relaxation family protein [Microbacterium sp. cx-55]UGB34478.1 replication-relaxation family protein [Microbacterium sp. cx-55]
MQPIESEPDAHYAPRISQVQLARLVTRLSERDGEILRFLSRQRYATTSHLRRMYFTNHRTRTAATRATIRVLDRLLSIGLVTRLERPVGGHTRGSAAFVWHLDGAGERLTRKRNASRRRFVDPALPFLEHSLQITETVTQLYEYGRADGSEPMAVEVESEAWRSFLGPAGTIKILKPDLYVALVTGDYEDHWYIEIDRGTESLPVLLEKCRTYEAYRRTGAAQVERGVFPRVLWVVPTERRVARLSSAIRADPDTPAPLFAVTTPDQLLRVISDPTPTADAAPEPRKEDPRP